MANPKITVEVGDIGASRTKKNLDGVTEAARRTQRASDAMANRAARQRLQLTRVAESLKNLQARLTDLGAQQRVPFLMQTLSQQIRGFEKAAKTGTLTTVDLSRRLQGVSRTTGTANRAMRGWSKEVRSTVSPMQGAAAAGGKWNEILRDMETAAILGLGPLSALGARIRALGVLFNRSSLGIAAFFTGITAAIVAIVSLSVGAFRAARDMENFESRLMGVSGSVELAQREIRKISEIALKTGADVRASISGYTDLAAAARGTGLEGVTLRKIFEDITKATVGLRLNSQSTDRIFTALTQAMSKGVLRAEELNQQLGDHLPGAQKLAADALGVTTTELNKMLKSGEIITRDFLPKFAAELAKVFGTTAGRSDAIATSFNRVASAAFEFFLAMDDLLGISSKVVAVLNALASAIEAVNGLFENEAITNVKRFSTELEQFLKISELMGGASSKAEIQDFMKEAKDNINDIGELIREQHEKVNRLKSGGFAARFGGNSAAVKRETEELNRLTDMRDKLIEGTMKLNNLRVREKDAIDDITKAEERLQRIMDEASDSIVMQRKTLIALSEGTPEAINNIDALKEAQDKLRGFNSKELESFASKRGQSVHELTSELHRLIQEAKELKDVENAINNTRTAQEKYNAEISKLEHLKNIYPKAADAIERAMDQAKRAMLESDEGFQLVVRQMNNFGDTLVDVSTGAKKPVEAIKALFKDMVDDILKQLIRLQVVNPILNSIFGLRSQESGGGGFGTGGGGFFGSFLQGFAGGFGGGGGASTVPLSRAEGGPTFPNVPTIVGERGPELLMPKGHGNVIPNHALGGQYTYVQQINVSPGVPEAVRREIHQLRPMLMKDALNAMTSVRRVGGRGRAAVSG